MDSKTDKVDICGTVEKAVEAFALQTFVFFVDFLWYDISVAVDRVEFLE